MIGWRGRIGSLIPSTNMTIEHEFSKMVPFGISVHFARMFNPETKDSKEKHEKLLEMGKEIKKASIDIACIKPSVIAFCCTSGSFVKNDNYDNEIINTIESETGIPAITTTQAVMKAFKILNLNRVALATPYNKEITDKEIKFFESNINNFKFTNVLSLNIVGGFEKGKLDPSSAYMAAKKVSSSESEAIFISCTAWRTIEIIDLLEKDLKKPVITSNQATMWLALREICNTKLEKYGKLFCI